MQFVVLRHITQYPMLNLKVNSLKHLFIGSVLGVNLLLASPQAFSDRYSIKSTVILTLEQAEQIAIKDEPGLASQYWKAQSLSERAVADGQLMDPKLQVGLINLPTDTFNFNQENMTQFRVGIVQQFPSGDTRNIKRRKTLNQSELELTKMAERKLAIIKEVRLTYLEIYYWEQAKKTITKNKQFFTQLVDIVRSLYSAGRNNQQDLIRAQLELSRLEERLVKITQKIKTQRSKLSRWIGAHNSRQTLESRLPVWPVPIFEDDFDSLIQLFISHPKIQQIDKQLEVSRKDIELAKENYKPGWALNAGYGYRDSNPNGTERADFLSVGVSIDLPLFTANRQDKNLLSKEHQYTALQDQRNEILRQLVADLQQEDANAEQLKKRQQLYNNLLLVQAKQQAQASLLAYQSDQGDFAEVMRAYIDNLNAKLDERRIAVDYLQSVAKILYFISSFQPQTNSI